VGADGRFPTEPMSRVPPMHWHAQVRPGRVLVFTTPSCSWCTGEGDEHLILATTDVPAVVRAAAVQAA
jgi:hypothetical protein